MKMAIHYFKDEIVIEDVVLTSKLAQDIATELSYDSGYRKVTFKNVIFENYSVEDFCNNLDFRCRNLERIMFQFYDTKISNYEMKSLSKLFPYFTKIHFMNAGLNNDSIKIIAEFLEKNPSNISTIHLENNRFGVEGHHALLDAITNNETIDKVFLKNTHDFRNGEDFSSVYEHLSRVLTVNSNIKILGIQESYVHYNHMEILFKGIECNKGLHKIELGNNFFIHDKSGRYTSKLAAAIKKQGLINQFTNEAPSNPHIEKIRTIINERETDKARFFFAVSYCDTEKLRSLITENKVNMNWTTANYGYNALHMLALSKEPTHKIEETIKLLYQYNFKELLYKRCAARGNKLQPIELAEEQARTKVAGLLYSIKLLGLIVAPPSKGTSNPQKNHATTYKACGFFAKALNDRTEFPSLPTTKNANKTQIKVK